MCWYQGRSPIHSCLREQDATESCVGQALIHAALSFLIPQYLQDALLHYCKSQLVTIRFRALLATQWEKNVPFACPAPFHLLSRSSIWVLAGETTPPPLLDHIVPLGLPTISPDPAMAWPKPGQLKQSSLLAAVIGAGHGHVNQIGPEILKSGTSDGRIENK